MSYVKQVGGTHYQSGGVEHWDYCSLVEVPNLEYASTKYMTRWRKKNGIQDLQKSLTYVEKRIACHREGMGAGRGARKDYEVFKLFCEDNQIPHEVRRIIDIVMHWYDINQLKAVVIDIKKLIEYAEEQQQQEELKLALGRGGY